MPFASTQCAGLAFHRQRLFGKGYRAITPDAAAFHRCAGPVKGYVFQFLDVTCGGGFHLLGRHGGSGKNARIAGTACNFGDSNIGFARQRLMRLQRCCTAVGHEKCTLRAARPGDTVGIGEGQQRAGAFALRRSDALRTGARARRFCSPCPLPGQTFHVLRTAGTIGTEAIHPMGDVDFLTAHAALDKHGGNIGSQCMIAGIGGLYDHACKARRQRQGAHGLAGGGDGACLIQSAEGLTEVFLLP